MLWTKKYRPRRVEDFLGNDEAKKIVKIWADSWRENRPQKPLLFYGPPGTGKTSMAYAVAEEYGWDIIEMNASDTRDSSTVERVLGSASQSLSLFGTRKLILIDEVDGLSPREDAGGLKVIREILEKSKNPTILTANDAWNPSVTPLHPYVRMVEFRRVPPYQLAKFLMKILEEEGIPYEKEAIEYLARKESGDVRSALLDLQAVARYGVKITLEIVKDLGYRDREANIFEVLARIFKSEHVMRPFTLLSTLDVDPDILPFWIAENIPREYERPEEIGEAFRWVSKADVYNGRILRRQYWGFLAYAQELLINGVIIAKKRPYKKFTRYSYPEWLRLLSRYKDKLQKRREAAKKLAKLFHTSSRRVLMDIMPYLPLIMKNEAWKSTIMRKARLTEEDLKALGIS